jgi:hypothetical protein
VLVDPSPAHREFYNDVVSLLDKHAGKCSAKEMLAIASQLVGKLIAMQDQRSMTQEIALKIVMVNIEEGNQQVFDVMNDTQGSA